MSVELRRPVLRVRRRVPFRAIRSCALLALLVMIVGRSNARCVPDRQPDPSPSLVDCSRIDPLHVRACGVLDEAFILEAISQARR